LEVISTAWEPVDVPEIVAFHVDSIQPHGFPGSEAEAPGSGVHLPLLEYPEIFRISRNLL
jgi:hypothetical protein